HLLEGGNALFFRSLSDRLTDAGLTPAHIPEELEHRDDASLASAIWDLVWWGRLTNDTVAPLRALLGSAGSRVRRAPPRPRGRYGRGVSIVRTGPPTVAGRWSRLPERESDPTRRTHALAEALLERHGVVTRGAVQAERVPGGFAAVYQVLKAFEEAGRVRRGYFVAGLGASQFAVPGAVDRMRAVASSQPEVLDSPWATAVPGGWDAHPATASQRRRRDEARAVVLAAADPANPYGAALPWPPTEGTKHRPARKAGALVVVVDGALVLYVERGGRTLLSFRPGADAVEGDGHEVNTSEVDKLGVAADALALAVRDGALGKLTVETADGQSALTTPLGLALEAAGFRPTPRGLRLRA
ncbi:MAG TPA: hypothetical protein VNA30_01665, partial [Mycobacteriales bacterium]|nr:hypothetical protein [Mycobacteriales bacterium]